MVGVKEEKERDGVVMWNVGFDNTDGFEAIVCCS